MLTEKANAICLLEVLKEYSDAEHILPMREIIATVSYTHLDVYKRQAILLMNEYLLHQHPQMCF